MSCTFAAPGRQEACLSLQKQRTERMARDYDRNDCYSCPMRRKRLEGSKEPERIAIPPGQFNKTAPIPPQKKETAVATKGKEAILRRIENEKICSRGRLTCFCSVTAAELDVAVKELETEGKIKSWEKKRGCLYTLPDAPDPRLETASKPPRSVNRKSATPPIKSRARKAPSEGALPARHRPGSNGDGVYAAAIADLEVRRTEALDQVEKFDRAIETLRALA